MKGNEVYDNTFVIRLEPLAAFFTSLQWNVVYVAQSCNGLAELVVEMSV